MLGGTKVKDECDDTENDFIDLHGESLVDVVKDFI